MDDKQGELKSN